MTANELFTIISQVSGLLGIVGSMLGMGLGLTATQILQPLKNVRLVVLALLANFVLVPLLAWGIGMILPLEDALKVGLMVLALSAGAPFLVLEARGAKANLGLAVGVMTLLMVVTIFYLPLVLPLLLTGIEVDARSIAMSLIVLMLIPLILGLLIKSAAPDTAQRWQPAMNKIGSLGILILLVVGLGLNAANVIGLVGSWGFLALLIFIAGSLLIGFAIGGRDPGVRIDPLRLALAFAASAHFHGAEFHTYHQIQGFVIDGKGSVAGVQVWDRTANKVYELRGDVVINATGAWAGAVLAGSGAAVQVTPTPGMMVAYDRRLVNRAINRLNEPGDGDILIPQRRMVVIGTTSYEVKDVDYIAVEGSQVEQMHRDAIHLVPAVASARQRGVYMSARPLVGKSQDGRSLSRTFKCFDHLETDGVDGLVTITGGKATTCRAMAEKTADLVCRKLGISAVCETQLDPLRSYRDFYLPLGELV